MNNYTVAIHAKTVHFDTIINTLQQYDIPFYVYVNMRVWLDNDQLEQSILVKNWHNLPERKQTEIRLLAYTVDTTDISDEDLVMQKQKRPW